MEPKSISLQRTETYALGNDSQGIARDYQVMYILDHKIPIESTKETIKISAWTIRTACGGSMDSLETFVELTEFKSNTSKEPLREIKTYRDLPSDITERFDDLPVHVKKLLK